MFFKRIVLSGLSTPFDPLGLVSPTIVQAKILMQVLWKLAWDKSLPMSCYGLWEDFRERLNEVSTKRFPWHVMSRNNSTRVERHRFSDASMRVYGCSLYVRSFSIAIEITVRLWSGKSELRRLKKNLFHD